MDRLEFIAKLEAELTFYSNKSKMEREAWVVRNFVDILGLSFNEDEITPGRDEPIDVEFRGGEFQIKELMDDGRRRMDEVRVKLARVRALKDDEINTVSSFEPDFVLTSKLIERVLPRMEQAIARYVLPGMVVGRIAICSTMQITHPYLRLKERRLSFELRFLRHS